MHCIHEVGEGDQEDNLNGPEHARKRMGNVGSPTPVNDKTFGSFKATFFPPPHSNLSSLTPLLTESLLVSRSMHELGRGRGLF